MNSLKVLRGVAPFGFGEMGFADAGSGIIRTVLVLRFMKSMVVGFIGYSPLKISWMRNLGFFEWW